MVRGFREELLLCLRIRLSMCNLSHYIIFILSNGNEYKNIHIFPVKMPPLPQFLRGEGVKELQRAVFQEPILEGFLPAQTLNLAYN